MTDDAIVKYDEEGPYIDMAAGQRRLIRMLKEVESTMKDFGVQREEPSPPRKQPLTMEELLTAVELMFPLVAILCDVGNESERGAARHVHDHVRALLDRRGVR